MKFHLRKITTICFAAILSCAVLLSQGCGNNSRNDSSSQETPSDPVLENEPDASDGNPESDSNAASGNLENDLDTDAADSAADPSGSENTVPGLACPSVNGALHVEGTQLTDKNGNPVQLRGISTHGIAWFPDYINEACFQQLHEEWHANVIRLAMYTAEYGGYCTGGDQNALKQLIRDGVTYAEKQDMYVVIDWHVLSDADPNLYLEDAKAFFQEMAGTYAGSNHVLYEICNEPNGGTTWSDIKSYAEQVIPCHPCAGRRCRNPGRNAKLVPVRRPGCRRSDHRL